jgi:hypothetical protein
MAIDPNAPQASRLPPTGGGEELREHGMGELIKQLASDTQTLVKQEMALARAELTQKGKRAGVGAGFIGAAGVLGLGAFGALTAFFILILDTWMPASLAALIVTAVYGAVAAVLGLRGKEKVQEAVPPTPEQTVETIKEDVQWAKTQMPSGSK